MKRWIALVVALVVLVGVGLRVSQVVSWPPDPFAEQQTDRSGPALLQSMRDLSRYEAAEGSFQVVIDLSTEARFIPSSLVGEHDLFVALGTVNAYVDFDGIGTGAVHVSDNRRTAMIRLPHAALEHANLDEKHSHLVSQQKGLLSRFGDFLTGSPDNQQKLYRLAQRKIDKAAAASQLRAQAERNTRSMLTGLLRSLGYTSVTVTFGAAT